MKDYLAIEFIQVEPWGGIEERMREDELLLQRTGVAFERIKEGPWERDAMRRSLLVDGKPVQTYEVRDWNKRSK